MSCSSSQEVDDLVDGCRPCGRRLRVWTGFGGWRGGGIGCWPRAADALVEEHEEQGDAGSLVSEAVSITAAVALQQSMGFHFGAGRSAVESGSNGRGCVEAGKDRLMDVGGAPAQNLGAGVQEHLHRGAQHAGVVDFDAGDFACTGGDGQGQALEEGRIDVDVERLVPRRWRSGRIKARVRRTVSRLSRPFFKPKSFRLLLRASRRRKVENFSYMRSTAFLA